MPKIDENNEWTRFDRCEISKDVDVFQEYDWADFNEVFSFVGANKEEWIAFNLTRQITDLIYYYGFENVFGSTYWEGFEIKEHSNVEIS